MHRATLKLVLPVCLLKLVLKRLRAGSCHCRVRHLGSWWSPGPVEAEGRLAIQLSGTMSVRVFLPERFLNTPGRSLPWDFFIRTLLLGWRWVPW